MALPPDHVAATVDAPLKRSSTAMTLVPAPLGLPWVAYQEIIVWVTSCSWNEPPLIPHRVRGLLALDTSASTGLAAPCSLSTASCGAGEPAQLACRAAQDGTAMGLGGAIGEGDGLGLGLSTAVGVGLVEGVGETVGWPAEGASGPFAVQEAIAASDTRRTTPFLMAACNEAGYPRVTPIHSWRKSHRIPVGRLVLG